MITLNIIQTSQQLRLKPSWIGGIGRRLGLPTARLALSDLAAAWLAVDAMTQNIQTLRGK